MQSLQKQIALDFSGGKFEATYIYLADDVTFNIVGGQLLTGKQAVTEFCTQIAEYFKTVPPKAVLDNVIVGDDCVAINGTAEFFNEKENRTNYISSCDVYKFAGGKLAEITSYCISTKKE